MVIVGSLLLAHPPPKAQGDSVADMLFLHSSQQSEVQWGLIQ